MERRQLSEFGEAVANAKDVDILECSEQDIFNVMKDYLLKAFDTETTFDMRLLEQMELMPNQCSVGITKEKDEKLYPFVKLAIVIRDGDMRNGKFKINKHRDAEFEITFTPFNCTMEKYKKQTGVYGGSDKMLTHEWRNVLRIIYGSIWDEKFKKYLEDIKSNKINRLRDQKSVKVGRIKAETEEACKRAEDEYNSELAALGMK